MIDKIPINNFNKFKKSVQSRMQELGKLLKKFNNDEKLLKLSQNYYEKDKDKTENNISELKIENSNLFKYNVKRKNFKNFFLNIFFLIIFKKIVENGEFINNFNQELEDMINSVDLNKFDLNENLDNEETLENINILKEKILNSFNDLPNQTIDGEISNRLINNINKLNHQQKNLFTKIEKEFKIKNMKGSGFMP